VGGIDPTKREPASSFTFECRRAREYAWPSAVKL